MIEWVLVIGLVLAALNVLVLYGITHQHRDRLVALERAACSAPRLPQPDPRFEDPGIPERRPRGHVHTHGPGGCGHPLDLPAMPLPPELPSDDPLDGLTESELRALGIEAFDRADELELARRNPRAET